MKYEIKIPSMGESIAEATVGTIIKPSGSVVAMDDEILELETDKVNQVLYAPQAGIITINVQPNDTVNIGQVIGHVETEGAQVGVQHQRAQQAAAPKKEKPAAAEEKSVESPQSQQKELEKLVMEPPQQQRQNTSPEESAPSEKNVRLTKERWIAELQEGSKEKLADHAVSSSKVQEKGIPSQERRETRSPMSKIRRLIANRLVEVQQNTAMLTTFNEVDMTEIMNLREKYKEPFAKEHEVKLGFMSFFVKASAAALLAFPAINSYIEGEDIVHREYVDIGIAVGTPKGLIVPVVRNCDRSSFAEIELAIEAYAKKARGGGLAVADLQGGGFTITNGGVYGSLLSTPILNPPQCAILGMHKIMKRAVVVNDEIVIRQMMYLALSYDHRVIDGKEAVSFLVFIKQALEDPARLLLGV